MSKPVFYDFYFKKPPAVNHDNDNDTVLVSQSEVKTSGLAYQLKHYGMDSLSARMEEVRSKFGYADTTNCGDFTDIQNKYVSAVQYFESLPSEIRRKFADRPDVFYDNIFKDVELSKELGIIPKDFIDKSVSSSDNVELNPVNADTSLANQPKDDTASVS